MRTILKLFFYFFIISNTFSADFIMTVSGVDKYPIYEKIDDKNIFMVFSNKNQFTTNTSMFGFGTCDGTIEIKDGEHHRNILCTVNDSFGNKGYLKAVEANKKKIIGNMIGDRLGSSIASWEWIGGNGPFEELKGIIITGAYFQMGKNKHGDGNFIWRGKVEGVSAKLIERINNYKKPQ